MKKYPSCVIKPPSEVEDEPVVFLEDEMVEVEPCGHDWIDVARPKHPPIKEESAMIQVRRDGKLANRGFFLHDNYNWQIVEDDQGYMILVPTKKKN